jgi:hypothetical protein
MELAEGGGNVCKTTEKGRTGERRVAPFEESALDVWGPVAVIEIVLA